LQTYDTVLSVIKAQCFTACVLIGRLQTVYSTLDTVLYITNQFFFKENVWYPVCTCTVGTRFLWF